MNIDKSQALLIYTFIFTHLGSEKTEEMFDEESYNALRDLQECLSDFLIGDNTDVVVHDDETDDSSEEHCGSCGDCDSCEDKDASDEEEDENNSVEEPEADDFLTTELLNDLSSVLVTSPTGSKITLEFEDVDEGDRVDVLLDEGSVIIQSITRLKVSGKTIEVFDGQEWHAFLMEKKFPKSWSKKIKNDVMYGFKNSENE